MIDLVEMARSGHVTKVFDCSVLPRDTVDVLLQFLQSVPASFNIQACHYLIAGTAASRARVALSMEGGFEANQIKIATASHVIVFCTRSEVPSEHLAEVFAQEVADGKYPNSEQERSSRALVRRGLDMHIYDNKDLPHWLEKQTYLALGMTMMAAAAVGVDVTPMEGFSSKKLDEEFGLRERGYTSTLLLSLGRRDSNDWILDVPKSRLPSAQIFTFLD